MNEEYFSAIDKQSIVNSVKILHDPALGVGTDLVDVKAIRAGEAHIVTERARQFLEIVREARSAT